MAHFHIKVRYDGFDDDYVIYNSIHLMTMSPNYDDIVYMDFSDNDIYYLPRLPNKLKELLCCNCKLSSIKELPDTLLFLNCSNNGLTSICMLPSRLRTLGCAYNQLCSLPELPSRLESLWCNNNNMISFNRLPNTLEFLHCQDNPRMERFPPLPYNMIEFKG